MFELLYIDGRPVRVGDIVEVNDLYETPIQGVVVKILGPNSKEAENFDCQKTGGILMEMDNGDCHNWPEADQHLSLIRRAEG